MSFSNSILQSWKYLLLIVVVVGFVYARTVSFDFVNYDDNALVYENSNYLSNLSNIFSAFTTHAFASQQKESVYYRPVLLVSFIIDYQTWKLNPFGYHLTNILLHCITTLLIFSLLESLLNEKLTALFASLFFALHPIQVESVAWIAGRNDILLGLFIIMMVFFYHRHYKIPEKARFYLLLSALSFTLALFTKESAAFYILLLPVYDLMIRKDSPQILISRNTLLKFMLFIFILGVYLFIRLNIFGQFVGAERLYGKISFAGRLKFIPAMFSEHLKLLFVPIHLSVQHPLEELIWLESPWDILAIGILVIFSIFIWWSWRCHPLLCFGLLWLSVSLLPILNIFPVAVPILEHRLYVAIVGFAIVVYYLLRVVIIPNRKRIAFFVSAIIIFILAIGTYIRLPVWQNTETLWMDAIEKTPTARRPYLNLSGYYNDKQEYKKAIELLKKSIELDPKDLESYKELRQAYYLIGQRHEVANLCKRMIALEPRNAQRYLEAGVIFEELNLPDTAEIYYRQGLQFDSTNAEIFFRQGVVFERLKRFDFAEQSYRRAIVLNSSYTDPYEQLSILYITRNDVESALQLLEQGLKFVKPSREYINILSNIYHATGRVEQAQALKHRYKF